MGIDRLDARNVNGHGSHKAERQKIGQRILESFAGSAAMTTDITAVIPTYNRERTISRSIRSALDQELAPTEILVVDDGSTDETRTAVQAFGGRVRYILREHEGVSAARNAGVAESRNNWIAFLDSDDFWLPDHLSKIAAAIESTYGDACCYFSNALLSHGGVRTYWDLCRFDVPAPYCLKRDASDWALMQIQPMLLPASVIRKQTLCDVGGMNRDMTTREDTLLFYKLAFRYPFCAVANDGLMVTDDGAQRLTRAYDSRHVVYWDSTILMYTELLSRPDVRQACHRRIIMNRLSDAYTGLAKAYMRTGNYGKASHSAFAAALASPLHFLMSMPQLLAPKRATGL